MNVASKITYFFLTVPLVIWGYFNESAYTIILAEVSFSVCCLYLEYKRGIANIGFIAVYSLFTVIYCIANFFVVQSINTPEASAYDYYLAPEFIYTALSFTYLGNVFCVLGFEYYQRRFYKWPKLIRPLRLELSVNSLRYILIVVSALNILVFYQYVNFDLVYPFLIAVLFFLVRNSFSRGDTVLILFCLLNTVLLSLNGLLYAYLRMMTIAPSIAYIIAVVFSKGELKVLFSKYILPIYGLLVIAVVIFPLLGKLRTEVYGMEKASSLMMQMEEYQLNNDESIDVNQEHEGNFMARLSNVNQTSQIVKLVESNGYYKGNTLSYLAFAFIPRFIWKEKPAIAQGIWFALEIGQAYVHDDGRANNSINMTSAGELYLNFGFIGVVLGMFMIGLLCAFMWQVSGFQNSISNILGAFFGLYLFYLATSTFGIDLQFLVTLFSYFVLFQIINYGYYFVFKPQS